MTPEERETREQCITATFVVITIFAVLCALAGTSRGDDAAYWRARANAAIAINASLTKTGGTDAAPGPVEAAKPPAKAKPVVNLYSATWCAPCQAAKAELKAAAKDLPFTVRIVDVSKGGQPAYVKSLPWVSWPKVEGEVWQRSYPGVKELVEQWEKSQSKASHISVSSAGRAGTSMRTGSLSTHRYTWPGDLRHHLRTTHGITESLTHEQAVMVHNAIHSGYSVTQIRAWARSRGYIK